MSQFPMNNQWMLQQWPGQGGQGPRGWNGGYGEFFPMPNYNPYSQGDPRGTGRLLSSGSQLPPGWGNVYANGPTGGGGLTGQQSGGASWPGGLTGIQSNYPWWGGPFQTPSVNGSTYTDMPAYNMPNWFNNAPWDVTQWQNMTPEQLQATIAFNQQAMPWTQMAQAYQQWQNEFNQNAYQWGNEFDWKKTGDQFSMDLATRQQDTSEKQWGDEFGLKSQEQADLNKWRDTQATLEREKMVTDQENQALASWGRKLRPNTRWM
jgi:hypothetical protein